jgi:transcriptional regulator with XRE-family HTH domain
MATEPDLAKRLAAWRAHTGRSFKEIGDAAGLTRQAAFNLENGTSDTTIRKLHLICRRAFKIDLATFFGPLP